MQTLFGFGQYDNPLHTYILTHIPSLLPRLSYTFTGLNNLLSYILYTDCQKSGSPRKYQININIVNDISITVYLSDFDKLFLLEK